MFNINNIFNIKKALDDKKEKFNEQVEDNTSIFLIRSIIFLSIVIDIIISFFFVLFGLTYINEINPKIQVNYQYIFLILVYLLLISSGMNIFIDFLSILFIP